MYSNGIPEKQAVDLASGLRTRSFRKGYTNCYHLMCSLVSLSLQADQSERPILVAFFWVLLQIWLFLYPLSIAVHGNIKKGIVYEEVLVFLTGISCLLEVVMSESWIAKARNEAQSLKVPSWMELAILTGYDPDAEGADRRFKGEGEIEDMK